MNGLPIKTPGIYIDEVNAFPTSVVPVATAVPAFIGYTPNAMYQGKSYINKAVKIGSFAEFKAIYGYPDTPAPASPIKQYHPEYYLIKQLNKPEKSDYIEVGDAYYSIVPDPYTVYYFYNSIQLFYQNGGGAAYIVSVGTYGTPSQTPMTPGDQILNPNVVLADLLAGLAVLKNEQEPTMYICPEATLLSVASNGTLMQAMLLQSSEMGTSISIFDVIGGRNPDPLLYTNDIETFRENTGVNGLSYGAAYYPFVGTTLMQNTDIDYTNLFGGDVTRLAPLLNPPSAPNQSAAAILAEIQNGDSGLSVSQLHIALLQASKTYTAIISHVLADVNLLPPSGGMAGVITLTDTQKGVWQAPANITIIGAISLPIRLTNEQQADLNVDVVSGKSINAIRFFNGIGILVWGARTLDGNSMDWKYVNVRRTIIFIEQSCKLAAQAFVFEPNNATTWESVKAMINSFLTSLWKEGGLIGTTPADAFSVACGVGSTMTSDDILQGIMVVEVKIAIVRPAEFIVLTFQQQMATSN